MNERVLWIFAGAVLFCRPVAAEAPDEDNGESMLAPIVRPVVTPTLRAIPVIQSPTTIQVITREDIQTAGIRNVSEALELLSGDIQVVQGSVGEYHSLRGYSSSSTFNERELILLDGQPLNDSALGTFDLSVIPTNNVDHIEIVAGPGSALYGPNAFGGVINIITRRPSEISSNMAEAFGGSNLLALGGVAAGQVSSTMWRAPETGMSAWSLSGLFDHNPGRSSVANSVRESGAIQASASLGANTDVSVGHYVADSGSVGYAFASPPTPHDRFRSRITTGMVNWRPDGPAGKTSVRLYSEMGSEQSRDERPIGSGAYTTLGVSPSTLGLSAQTRVAHGTDGGLLLGVDLRRLASSGGISKSASNVGVFAQEELRRGSFSPTVGLRYDYHSIYGGRLNPRLAATYQLSPRLYLRGTLGTSYRPPNFLELYVKGYVLNRRIPVPPFVIPVSLSGNPALRPEETTASELGIRGQIGANVTADAAVFWDQLRNLITFVVPPPPPGTLPVGTWANAGSAPIVGFETSVSRTFSRSTRSTLQYVYLDVHRTQLSSPAAIAPVSATPHHQLTWQSYTSGWRGFNAALLMSARSDSPGRGGAFNADLTVGHPITNRLGLQVLVRNAFDNKYQVGDMIPALGRSVFARVTGSF